ncbi:MAG TPA: hypothetical protein VIN63_03865 [Candidatus Limnocylindria bacterium]
MGILKMLAVLIAALGMAAFESVRRTPAKDEDDVALFVGSAHPLAAKRPISRRAR